MKGRKSDNMVIILGVLVAAVVVVVVLMSQSSSEPFTEGATKIGASASLNMNDPTNFGIPVLPTAEDASLKDLPVPASDTDPMGNLKVTDINRQRALVRNKIAVITAATSGTRTLLISALNNIKTSWSNYTKERDILNGLIDQLNKLEAKAPIKRSAQYKAADALGINAIGRAFGMKIPRS